MTASYNCEQCKPSTFSPVHGYNLEREHGFNFQRRENVRMTYLVFTTHNFTSSQADNNNQEKKSPDDANSFIFLPLREMREIQRLKGDLF